MKKKIVGILICMLFIVTSFFPSTCGKTVKENRDNSFSYNENLVIIETNLDEKSKESIKSTLLTSGNFLYVGGSGPNNYTKIEYAIENASDGDTVFVYHDFSPYIENIIVDKSINLIGENKVNTIINGEKGYNTILIADDRVNVSNFTIKNGKQYGITIDYSNYVNISNNYIENNNCGVEVFKSTNIEIKDNYFKNNWESGIQIYKSNYTNIISNDFFQLFENVISGITLSFSLDCKIVDNSLIYSGISLKGDDLDEWTSHTIENNFVNGKPMYYYKNNNENLIVPPNAGQVILANCKNIEMYNLELNYVDYGIQLGFSSSNKIDFCNIVGNNKCGIYLKSSFDNYIYENTISNYRGNLSNKTYGIRLDNSDSNYIQNSNEIRDNIYGIYIYFSDNNYISNNVVSQNHEGIYTWGDEGTIIINNSINFNNYSGTNLGTISGNFSCNYVAFNEYIGLLIDGDNNIISYNEIDKNYDGIHVEYGNENEIYCNDIFINTQYGLYLNSAIENKIFGNVIEYNKYGVFLENSRLNQIKRNNFINNVFYHASFKDSFTTFWFNNYWDDWPGIIPKPIYGISFPWLNIGWFPSPKPLDIC